MTTSSRTVMRIYFHVQSADLYEQLLTVLAAITPRVQPHPADLSADVDLTGALRYWDRDPEGLAAVIRLRALALYGVQSSAGVGPSRMIAAMASAITPLGAATIIGRTPCDVAAFLRPRRASALPGVGPATARTLTRYGINTVGDIADTPLATLQRILGIAAGRQAHDRAHGTDDRPVIPAAAPQNDHPHLPLRPRRTRPRTAPPNRPRPRRAARLPAPRHRRGMPSPHPDGHLRRPHQHQPHPDTRRTHRPHPGPCRHRTRAPHRTRSPTRPRPSHLPACRTPPARRTRTAPARPRLPR